MMSKKWTYHVSHSYTDAESGEKTSCATQLYSLGVYAIINGDASLQFNWKPKDLVKTEKALEKAEKNGEIADLVFGREITVIDDGFFKEV